MKKYSFRSKLLAIRKGKEIFMGLGLRGKNRVNLLEKEKGNIGKKRVGENKKRGRGEY